MVQERLDHDILLRICLVSPCGPHPFDGVASRLSSTPYESPRSPRAAAKKERKKKEEIAPETMDRVFVTYKSSITRSSFGARLSEETRSNPPASRTRCARAAPSCRCGRAG